MTSLRPPEFPRREPSFKNTSSAQLAMYIGLGSLTVFFGASLIAYFVTRLQASGFRSTQTPHLPGGLWVSTALLVLLSIALHAANRGLSRNNRTGLLRGLSLAILLAVLFLLAQVQNWRTVASALLTPESRTLYVFSFYFLTALHALHVLVGILPLGYVYARAKRDEYSSSRNEGVRLLRQYWDFLLVIWLVLLAALWL